MIITVEYEKNVKNEDKDQGLVEFVEKEAGYVFEYIAAMQEKNGCKPRHYEISNIILSPEIKSRTYGKDEPWEVLENIRHGFGWRANDYLIDPLAIGFRNFVDIQINKAVIGSATGAIQAITTIREALDAFGSREIICSNYELCKIVENIEESFEERKVECMVAGEYIPSAGQIYIYYKVINALNPSRFKAGVRMTLAHEILHLVHDMYAGREFKRSDKNAQRVQEALADFFAFMYCLEEQTCKWGKRIYNSGYCICRKLYNEWQEKAGSSWPYAYARKLMHVNLRPVEFCDIEQYDILELFEKFNKVFVRSRKSMDCAYEELVKQ